MKNIIKSLFKSKPEINKYVEAVMEKTGWEMKYAVEQMASAKNKVGISYRDYDKYDFHTVPSDKQEEGYKKVLKKKEKRRQQKEDCITCTMEEMGWEREYAVEQIEDTRERLGVTYKHYKKFKLYDVPKDQQKEVYENGLKEEAKKQAKKEKQKEKDEKYLKAVMEKTGWTREVAEEKMIRAKETSGASFEHYLIYRFWEISEEEQKTYFTKGDAVKLRRKYTKDPNVKHMIKNKDIFYEKFDKYLGREWIKTEGMTLETFKEKFKGEKKVMYKPLASTGGHGIYVFEVSDDKMEDVFNELTALPEGIVEGYVIQHPEMQRLSLNSVNTIRIVTVRTDEDVEGVDKDKVNFVYAGVRMGQGKSYVDNLHSGGMMAILNLETGEIITNGANHENLTYEIHPDTGVKIKGFKVPCLEEAKAMIMEAGQDVPGFIGWDVAITENGPIIIEANGSPGADGLQIPYVPEKIGAKYVIEKYL